MTVEKKTFKNPSLDYNTDAWRSKEWGWQVDEEIFPEGQYDMEVTFTKKVKPPKIGDKAQSPSGWDICKIAGIDGDEIWLRFDDGSHCTIGLDKLIYAS